MKYGSDRAKARAILEQCVGDVARAATEEMRVAWRHLQEKFAIEDAAVDPMVFLTAKDIALEYTVRYLVHYKLRRSTKTELAEKILQAFDANADKVSIAGGA